MSDTDAWILAGVIVVGIVGGGIWRLRRASRKKPDDKKDR